MNPESRIFVADVDGVTWLRVVGKGSFQNSPDMKRYVEERLASGEPPLVVDLEDCTGLDSTFMGALTGIALSLRSRGDGSDELTVVNANARNRELLENLGLDQIFHLDSDGTMFTEQRTQVSDIFSRQRNADGGDGIAERSELPRVTIEKDDRAKHVLEAHEALASANEANVVRFQDVVDFFRRDLENSNSR